MDLTLALTLRICSIIDCQMPDVTPVVSQGKNSSHQGSNEQLKRMSDWEIYILKLFTDNWMIALCFTPFRFLMEWGLGQKIFIWNGREKKRNGGDKKERKEYLLR